MKRIPILVAVLATLVALSALSSSPARALSVHDVCVMKQAAFPDSVIAEKIIFSCQVFNLEDGDIEVLHAAGVSEAVIGVMRHTASDLAEDSNAISVTKHEYTPPAWAYPGVFEPAESNSDRGYYEDPNAGMNSSYALGGYYGNYYGGYYFPHYHYGYYGVHNQGCNFNSGAGHVDHHGSGGGHGGGSGGGGSRGWVGYQGGGAAGGGSHGGGMRR